MNIKNYISDNFKISLSLLCLFFQSVHINASEYENEYFEKSINLLFSSVIKSTYDTVPIENTSAFYICRPGIPQNVDALNGMQELSNPNGNINPLQSFSYLVDKIPNVSTKIWEATENTVSGAYRFILEGANSNSLSISKVEMEKYEAAASILWTKRNNLRRETIVPTEEYNNYLKAQSIYEFSLTDYQMALLKADLKTKSGREDWLIKKEILQTKIDQSYASWVANYKLKIEEAINIMGSTLKNGTAYEITRVKEIFDQYKLESSPDYYPAYMMPEKWWDTNTMKWATISISLENEMDKEKCCSLSILHCFFCYFKCLNHRKNENWIHIEMEYTVVSILRPWLYMDWLKAKDWYLSSGDSGSISSGTITDNTNEKFLPVIPSKFVVVRNVNINSKWDKQIKHDLIQKINTNKDSSYGVFFLGGNSKSDDTSQFFSYFENETLRIPGMQIIGFWGVAPPKSPQQDNNSTKSVNLTSHLDD